MRLEIFDFIDDTINLVESYRSVLENGTKELEDYFKKLLLDHDNVLNISSRIKSSMSLKEKILRNDFYLKYKSPEKLVENLSDLIGLRIECRFIEEEEDVYNELLKIFNLPNQIYFLSLMETSLNCRRMVLVYIELMESIYLKVLR